jgi:Xaa-Pro aminopeptidase
MGVELRKTFERPALAPQYPYMPKSEWELRTGKIRGLMEKKGLDALMVLNDQDRLYFFGCAKSYKYAYPSLGIIPRKGPTVLMGSSEDCDVVFAEGYVDRLIGYRGDTRAPSPTAPDPISLVVEVMNEMDLGNKKIGMEFGQFMWWDGFNMNEWERFKKEMPEAKFIDATDLIWEMRMIKSDWEIEVMRRLYYLTSKGYSKIIQLAKPGANERGIFYEALKYWIDEGMVESNHYLLGCTNMVHPFRDRILKEGDFILLDAGPMYKGYEADIQRMIHIGDPGKEARWSGSFAYEGQLAVEAILKPGITAGDIWMTSISKVAEGDKDMWRKVRSRRFPGWVGHGSGLNLHEPPYLVENSDVVIKEGMVLAIEIPSFHGRKFMNMPEDGYLITKDGFEKLTLDFGPGDIYVKT